MTAPVIFEWTDEGVMRPLRRFAQACDKQFVIGERYLLEAFEQRSHASHSHYFACINDAWENLPEVIERHFPSSEHLRKYALCMTGYRDEQLIPCNSQEDAKKIAGYVRTWQKFAVITIIDGNMVRVWTPQSQDHKSMDRKQFQESKTKVLEFLEEMIGVQRGHFARQS